MTDAAVEEADSGRRWRSSATGPAPADAGPVLLLCPSLFSIRNVLHSRLLPGLRELGHRVEVLGLPGAGPVAFAEPGPDQRFSEIDLAPRKRVTGAAALGIIQNASFYRRHRLTTDRLTQWWYRRHEGVWRRVQYGMLEAAGAVGAWDPLYRWQMRRLETLRLAGGDMAAVRRSLASARPSLVVATSCINPIEDLFLAAARDLGVPTLGCIQSFDHLTGRSLTADCDHYAVWNERMRDQLLRYHPVRAPSQVSVTGTPQFDFHVRPEFRWSRERLLRELGMAENERYIAYAATTESQTPTEPVLVAEFIRRAAASPVLGGHRVLVRVHPNDDFGRWKALAASAPRAIVSLPATRSEAFNGPEDQARLVSTLLHADVSINVWSSMSLDAAAVGTPVVCVAFAGVRGTAEDRFCRMVYETDFYAPIARSGGVRLAYDMDALVAEAEAYVRDRRRDEAARRQLAAAECGPLDGRSAERIGRLIDRLARR
ncbi:MAG TPA: hypothetical protein VJ847_09485 [Gemmatimonadales bacterium]|jgi:hypothetical protein|nr:hypothetical protein [Gemmatimonadales bacterium]